MNNPQLTINSLKQLIIEELNRNAPYYEAIQHNLKVLIELEEIQLKKEYEQSLRLADASRINMEQLC